MTTDDTASTETQVVAPKSLDGHCGCIQIEKSVMDELLPQLTLEYCDIQRTIHDRGIFTALHDKLQLPESYTIRATFFEVDLFRWSILLESPELPDIYALPWRWRSECPRIDLVYCHNMHRENGQEVRTTHLVDIKVNIQRSFPVTGGVGYLLNAHEYRQGQEG